MVQYINIGTARFITGPIKGIIELKIMKNVSNLVPVLQKMTDSKNQFKKEYIWFCSSSYQPKAAKRAIVK